jgi:hypothetical protein
MASTIKRESHVTTPSAFMSKLDECISDLTMLSKPVEAGVDRYRYPPVNARVDALSKLQVIPAELAGELLDAIPLLSRANAGKSEFYEEASEWAASRGPAVLAELKQAYQRAVTPVGRRSRTMSMARSALA